LYAQIIKQQIDKIHLHSLLIFLAKSKGGNSDLFHTVYQMLWLHLIDTQNQMSRNILIVKIICLSKQPEHFKLVFILSLTILVWADKQATD
jgi:hypothetical protein